MPRFQIQKPPKPFVKIAMFATMFLKNALYRSRLEQAAVKTTGIKKNSLNYVQLRTSQPLQGVGKPSFGR